MQYTFTNQSDLRDAFWAEFPELECRTNRKGNPKRQNEQPTDTRCAFVDWIDHLHRNGDISDSLSNRATL